MRHMVLIWLLLLACGPAANAEPRFELVTAEPDAGGERTARGDTLYFFAPLGDGAHGAPGTNDRGYDFEGGEGLGEQAGWTTDGGPFTIVRLNDFLPGLNESCMWTFFDTETQEEGYPMGVYPYGPPYQNCAIQSPDLEMTPAGEWMDIPLDEIEGNLFLRYDIYRDLPLNALIFYKWEVAARSDEGSYSGFRDNGTVYYSTDGWGTRVEDIGYLVEHCLAGQEGNLAGVRIRLSVVDNCPLWCDLFGSGEPHTLGPLFDNVQVFHVQDATGVAAETPPAAPADVSVRPNPFNPETEVEFSLSEAGPVAVEIHDLSGRRVKRLADRFMAAGAHALTWHGDNDRGEPLASGVYLVRVRTERGDATARAILLK